MTDRVCPDCDGTREVVADYVAGFARYERCPTCWGWGIETDFMRYMREEENQVFQVRGDPPEEQYRITADGDVEVAR